MAKGWMSGALAGAAFLGASAAAAQDFTVPIDMAAPIHLSSPAQGVAIGNPAIAGVSVQNDTLLFVTGRSYGTTNLVVVGAGGRTIFSGRVVVTPNETDVVTITRGLDQARYVCAPVCRPRPDIGDAQITSAVLNEQIAARNQQARTGNQ